MITCQVSYLPLSADDIYHEVSDATDIISRFDLEMEVNPLSTTIKGDLDEILKMVDSLYREMENKDKEFRLQIDLLSSKAYS